MEVLGVMLGWKTTAGLVGAAWVAWRGRKVHKALAEWRELRTAIVDARSESSPGGKSFTQEEVEKIVDEGAQALRALAPIYGKVFGKK